MVSRLGETSLLLRISQRVFEAASEGFLTGVADLLGWFPYVAILLIFLLCYRMPMGVALLKE